VHHTGIEARPVSLEDEVTMGVQAARALQRETGCDLKDCAAVVFVSPSYVPLTVARRLLDPQRAEQERLRRAARQLVRRLGIPECRASGMNWFCSGYSRAMAVACGRIGPRLRLDGQQFMLIVTATRISRITDYSCKQTAGLFGDLATATLVAPADSRRHPVHFEVLFAGAEKQRTEAAYFDFHLRRQVPLPRADGGRDTADERLVFSLDGMGIADIAPRAMAAATVGAVQAVGAKGEDVRFVVPHQAGAGIVRFTATKLEASGIGGEVINGLTKKIGNVSASSIPYALKAMWNRLSGLIACPTAAVGSPGAREVSQGCVLLKATAVHERQRQAAA
jgi:3-oxoacyl-[acyl-carrier-protein] synthase III